jgi:hypothetical protein
VDFPEVPLYPEGLGGWVVPVLDEASLRVVSALATVSELVDHRTTLVELLGKKELGAGR